MRKAINTSQLTIRQSSLSPPLAHATRNYVCTSPDAPEFGSVSRLESAPESRSNFGSGSESGSVSEFATIFSRPQTPRVRILARSADPSPGRSPDATPDRSPDYSPGPSSQLYLHVPRCMESGSKSG